MDSLVSDCCSASVDEDLSLCLQCKEHCDIIDLDEFEEHLCKYSEDYIEEYVSQYVCAICQTEESYLVNVGGMLLCESCDQFERTFDIDKYEEDKRRRIAEENEY